MKALIRADASTKIGTGHIMRCLSLANHLRQQGAGITFACRALSGHCIDVLREQQYTVLELCEEKDVLAAFPEASFDWIIMDHYGLSAEHEQVLHPLASRLLVIDDLADRPHVCDLLLDQNYYHQPEARYAALVPKHCRALLGPSYALLRPEFTVAHQKAPVRNGRLRQIMISFGGADLQNVSAVVLDALVGLDTDIRGIMIVGAACPHLAMLREKALDTQIEVLHNVQNMADLMRGSDLYIGAGGTTTWERMATGLPGLVLAIADNQVALSKALAEDGYQIYLGPHPEVSPQTVRAALDELMRTPVLLEEMSEKSLALVDGLGVQRVAAVMSELSA